MLLTEEILKEKETRLKKIDQMMLDLKLDAVLFTSTAHQAEQVNVKYAAKLSLSGRRVFLLKEVGKEPELFLSMAVDRKVYNNKSWVTTENLYLGNMIPTVLEHIEKLPQKKPRIGWATPDTIPHNIYDALISTKAEFVDVTKEYTAVRASKSPYEIKLTQITVDLAVASFEDLVLRIKPGMTELQLIGGAIGFLSERGAEDLLILGASKKPFATIKRPDDTKLTETDIFTYSAEFAGPGGYWVQIIRPIFMDRNAHPDGYETYQVAKEAEAAAMAVMRPGYKISDIHYAVESVIKKHNMRMSYWAGHGMGSDLGDGLDIVPDNDMPIVPNMILVVQPSVESATNSTLYGNTFLTVENGDPINITGKYLDTPYYDDLYAEISAKYKK